MYNFKKHRSILGEMKIILVYGPFIQNTFPVKISNAQGEKLHLKLFRIHSYLDKGLLLVLILPESSP